MIVNEIFESFHGEITGHHQGRMATFIRLAGCSLRCLYCDTRYAQDPSAGENLIIREILNKVEKLGNKYICLTGGEPLIHEDVELLLWYLWHEGYKISVETNGTVDTTPFHRYVESFVIDYKLPGISPNCTMIENNYNFRKGQDVLKFVIQSEGEFYTALKILKNLKKKYQVLNDPESLIAFSPCNSGSNDFSSSDLAELLLKEKVHNALISLQIHKIINFK